MILLLKRISYQLAYIFSRNTLSILLLEIVTNFNHFAVLQVQLQFFTLYLLVFKQSEDSN